MSGIRPMLGPGGDAKTTTGAGFRAEHGQTMVDPVVSNGDQAKGDAASTAGGWTSNDAIIEFDLPFLTDLPFSRALDGEARSGTPTPTATVCSTPGGPSGPCPLLRSLELPVNVRDEAQSRQQPLTVRSRTG